MIGLLTLYKNSYGSILQAFATKKFVESMLVECNLLDIDYSSEHLEIMDG